MVWVRLYLIRRGGEGGLQTIKNVVVHQEMRSKGETAKRRKSKSPNIIVYGWVDLNLKLYNYNSLGKVK